MSEERNTKNDSTKRKASNSDGDPTKRKAGKAWFFKRTNNNLKIYMSATDAPLSNRRKKEFGNIIKVYCDSEKEDNKITVSEIFKLYMFFFFFRDIC